MNENQIVVVVKGVIFNKGKVLIIKRSDEDKVGGGSWECVGGNMTFGEDLKSALIRETKEEVGLTITVERILYAITFKTDSKRQAVLLTYLCRSHTHAIALSNEHSDYLWATKEEVRLLLDPELRHDFEKNSIFSLDGFQ